MAANNQTTFGASVIPSPVKEDTAMLPPPTFESPALTPVASRDDHQEKLVPPHSPFYQHPPASHERLPALQTPPSKMRSHNLGVYEKDLESGPATPLSTNNELNPFTSKVSVDANKECTMWPSRKTLEQNRLADRRQKHDTRGALGFAGLRHWWATSSPKQKWSVRAMIALFVCGAIVAIAVGVTKAVHGGVYSGEGKSHEIGDHS